MVFCSNREIKMLRKLVFRLKREIKMLRNSQIVQENSEIKMYRKVHTAKISCHPRKFCLLSGKQFFLCKINLPGGDKSVKKIVRHFCYFVSTR